jgi:lipopolysaccharide transport system ATP-binding protein
MSSDIAVSVRGLSKSYTIEHGTAHVTTIREALIQRVRQPFRRAEKETFWALRDVSFDIARGDVVGIIGRNGAGKSTLLKLLSNITRPTEGVIDLYGRVGSLLEVGTGFHQELTGRENIYLNGAILGMKRREIAQQFDQIVDFAGVEQFLDTPVKRYSSGMYVRLAFAVAAHLNPEILIVDEVLAVGDAEFQKKCLGKMEDVASSGRTVLFVSHNEAAVRRLCKSAIYLRDGQVAFTGTPEDAFAEYRAQRDEPGFSEVFRTHSSREMRITNAYFMLDDIRTTELLSGVQPVLTMEVEVLEPALFSPELLLRDANSAPLLFAPIGLTQGIEYEMEPGTYRFSYQLDLPFLAAGKYSLDLMLSETKVRFYDYLEEALTFSVATANHDLTGWDFHQSRGQGCLLLDVREVSVTNADGQPVRAENAEDSHPQLRLVAR